MSCLTTAASWVTILPDKYNLKPQVTIGCYMFYCCWFIVNCCSHCLYVSSLLCCTVFIVHLTGLFNFNCVLDVMWMAVFCVSSSRCRWYALQCLIVTFPCHKLFVGYAYNVSVCKDGYIWASACDFQQCGILTWVDSDEPLQPPFKLRNSKWCSVSSLTIIEYSID